ncbi:MAG: colanic acid biosynthesis acetyltransferase WcaF [Ahniella sp.]|nr:colanic acid biosynthesis acetyltransferase WcaF [Ahniella sp.]
MTQQRLDQFDGSRFDRGRSRLVEILWAVLQESLFATGLPGSRWRAGLLRMFGAEVGAGVVIKPRVRVKFPWRLHVGDHSWIGEAAWIDNLAEIRIGSHTCISQGVYLCTGNHDWSVAGFDLRVAPILIGSGCWVGAFCLVAPGSRITDGSVLSLGVAWSGASEENTIYGREGSKMSSRWKSGPNADQP